MNTKGFTLVEVLIALAILSIALTAIIKSSSQNIKDTLYLQNKTIADWVGSEILTELTLGLIKLSNSNEGEVDALGKKWLWKATQTTTPNPNIYKIHVEIMQPYSTIIFSKLDSYIYDEKK